MIADTGYGGLLNVHHTVQGYEAAGVAAIGRGIDAPLMANIVQGRRTPVLPASRLAELGFAVAIYPVLGFLAAAAALDRTYAQLLEHRAGPAMPRPDSYGLPACAN